MKKLLAQRQIFQIDKSYSLGRITTELINQDKWHGQIFHQNTCVNFVNSSLNNSNWVKISESLTKKFHIWNRLRLSLRDKKIIINQILLSKLWYIAQIYTIPKYMKKEIEKKIYGFLWNEEENQNLQIF